MKKKILQGIDKEYNGFSAPSKENTEPLMERESQSIFNSSGSNSGFDSGDNGSISTGNPFAEGLKALVNAIKQEVGKEKVLAE